ncbi:hypothetical protein [Streptomyces naphthomycinicus]|uniref:hypothetical protein n=1 Tax=Streptomyces naphthomycinicus TaxID=2872625 RepID=UPI001CEC2A0A|nr:hypothetical protein [Streptomyces sp. TML10]
MPADEVTRGTDVDGSRARTGPRHAAPRKPLFTRFHMPAGKAIASVAMPTAVLMGMGFTSTLALADNNGSPSPSSSAKSLTADEYKDCVKALDDTGDPSASPSPSASESGSDTAMPAPSASDDGKDTQDGGGTKDAGGTSSPDSGSGDKATPEPTATSGSSDSGSGSGSSGSDAGSADDTATPAPSPTKDSGGNVLDTIGDTIGDILTGGQKDSGTQSATPTPSASSSPTGTPTGTSADDGKDPAGGKDSGGSVSDTVEDTAKKAQDTVEDTVKDTTDGTTGTAAGTAGDAAGTAGDATAAATPSPSASESASAEDCPVATDDESGVDNKVPVADDPWYLNASSLLLKGADYQGIVEVKTANGTTKKVLKYVISGGTDIGDLHQTVNDKQAKKTYHVQASKGSTSTITGGDTVMYTESISGNLFGLIPVTFSPDSPPPLNIPLIYFTNVKVVQAAQFGGNLHVPGMHVYTTD